MKKSILLFFLFATFSISAQEICNNAIDDDGDGLIDLNDDECNCSSLTESSLIPNPSFEDKLCCPNENAELDCAISWIQASGPTTDYVHTCEGYLGNNNFSPPAVAPLPFPDGEGGVGFRDGQRNAGSNYKEYVGACLTDVMDIGVEYRFDFFVGFRANTIGATSLNMAIFATTNCAALPFGGNSNTIGCPLNASGNFVQVGELAVSGNGEWVNVVFDFVADQPYSAIVLGPSCSVNPNWQLSPYFYLDRLALEESGKFGVPFQDVTGSICQNNLLLQMEDTPSNSYQWYLDGIAIIGATNSSLMLTALTDVEGKYQCIVNSPDGCLSSKEYDLRIPPYYASQNVQICENQSHVFVFDTLNQTGIYEQTIQALDGCDSIITLNLEVFEHTAATLYDTFCIGEEYNFSNTILTESGTYQTTLQNSKGCDSLVTLELHEIGLRNGIDLAKSATFELGEVKDIRPIYYDPIYTEFLWTDSLGMALGMDVDLVDFQPFSNTVLNLLATDIFGCSISRTMPIYVIPNYELYVPNIFTPEAALDNQHFRFFAPISVESILSFQIYDRWGSLVFQDEKIDFGGSYRGWDGLIRGKKGAAGVYAWVLQVRFLDGVEKTFFGDVTLMR